MTLKNTAPMACYDAAFEEGNAAYHAGKLPKDNPYQPSMTSAVDATKNRGWFNGWNWGFVHAN